MRTVRRWGFKSRNQLPLFMVWEEYWHGGEVAHATVLFSTRDMRQGWWWRSLVRKLSAT